MMDSESTLRAQNVAMVYKPQVSERRRLNTGRTNARDDVQDSEVEHVARFNRVLPRMPTSSHEQNKKDVLRQSLQQDSASPAHQVLKERGNGKGREGACSLAPAHTRARSGLREGTTSVGRDIQATEAVRRAYSILATTSRQRDISAKDMQRAFAKCGYTLDAAAAEQLHMQLYLQSEGAEQSSASSFDSFKEMALGTISMVRSHVLANLSEDAPLRLQPPATEAGFGANGQKAKHAHLFDSAKGHEPQLFDSAKGHTPVPVPHLNLAATRHDPPALPSRASTRSRRQPSTARSRLFTAEEEEDAEEGSGEERGGGGERGGERGGPAITWREGVGPSRAGRGLRLVAPNNQGSPLQFGRRGVTVINAVPRAGLGLQLRSSMDMKAAIHPGPANPTHFASDSERYVTCYRASLDGGGGTEEIVLGGSKERERRAAQAKGVQRRRRNHLDHSVEEVERREEEQERRRAARIEKLARLQEEQPNFVQSGRARPHDIEARKAEAQNRFHMAPTLERQRLAKKKQIAHQREEKADMDQRVHDMDETLHKAVHQKQVERYQGFLKEVAGAKEEGEKATVRAHQERQRRYSQFIAEQGDHNQEKEDKRISGLRNDQARYKKFADDVKKRDETKQDSEKEAKRISGLKNDQVRYQRFADGARQRDETRLKGRKTDLSESVPAARRTSAVAL